MYVHIYNHCNVLIHSHYFNSPVTNHCYFCFQHMLVKSHFSLSLFVLQSSTTLPSVYIYVKKKEKLLHVVNQSIIDKSSSVRASFAVLRGWTWWSVGETISYIDGIPELSGQTLQPIRPLAGAQRWTESMQPATMATIVTHTSSIFNTKGKNPLFNGPNLWRTGYYVLSANKTWPLLYQPRVYSSRMT